MRDDGLAESSQGRAGVRESVRLATQFGATGASRMSVEPRLRRISERARMRRVFATMRAASLFLPFDDFATIVFPRFGCLATSSRNHILFPRHTEVRHGA